MAPLSALSFRELKSVSKKVALNGLLCVLSSSALNDTSFNEGECTDTNIHGQILSLVTKGCPYIDENVKI